MKTTKVSVSGKSNLTGACMYLCMYVETFATWCERFSVCMYEYMCVYLVVFEEEVWIPVWLPTLSQRLAVTIMNREFPRNDQVVATAYLDFDSIPRVSNSFHSHIYTFIT